MLEFFDEILLKYRLSEQTDTIFPIDNWSKDLSVIFFEISLKYRNLLAFLPIFHEIFG